MSVINKRDNLSSPEKSGNWIFQEIYYFLSSVKLALSLLALILVCCLVGVTVFRGERAGAVIFSTLWFNGILVLLVINIAFCFFGRIWGRKITLISLGMILFHLSFVAMLAGVIYNSQFYFRGLIRLTEGETLPSGDSVSYDYEEHGRFFDFSQLKGETTLIKMHKGYTVDGTDKQVAYEIAVGEGQSKKQGVVYITHKLEHNGFGYFRDREGYSVLVILVDRSGEELYGAYVPLQSFKQKTGQYLYSTGTQEGPEAFPFPQEPMNSVIALQAAYHPLEKQERDGEAVFQVWQLNKAIDHRTKPMEGRARIGKKVKVGDYYLSAREVRYWVVMTVRHDPGKPIVLGSLCIGLFGMIITFVGRMRKDNA